MQKILVEIEVPKGGGCIGEYDICDYYFMKYSYCNLFNVPIHDEYKCSKCKEKLKVDDKYK